MKYSLYIGRWQPFHNGHDYIIRQALDNGKNVAIGVRDTPISESDPYTLEDRISMIRHRFASYGDRVMVFMVPDIESVCIGRKVGYEVIRYDAPENIEGISATKIRKMMDEGDDTWKNNVPSEIAEFLDKKKGLVIWFTGLSGAGKTTLAQAIKSRIGRNVKVLDGDEVRQGLTSDLGFSKKDRDENIKRVSYVAKCVADVNQIAIVSAISPYEEARNKARELIGKDRFILVHVDAELDVLIERDVKGLYKRALAGEIKGFTGIDDPYEKPECADIVVRSDVESVEESVERIMKELEKRL